jgi:hypothetical protein
MTSAEIIKRVLAKAQANGNTVTAQRLQQAIAAQRAQINEPPPDSHAEWRALNDEPR